MIEQLILLAMRCLMVFLLMLLISRLVLDSTQLSLFRGAKSHHFVILDDSGSMNDRWEQTTAFEEGVDVVKRLLSQGSRQAGRQQVSIMLMSQPDKLLITERSVDESLLVEVTTKLNALKCTSRALEPRTALERAQQLLADDRAVVRQVHVVTDFRREDWTTQPGVAGAIKSLDEAGIDVNVARVVPEQHANLAVTKLVSQTSNPAVGVPVRFEIGVRNFGESVAKDVALTVLVDGQRLPITVQFLKVEAGSDVAQTQDITFDTPGQHSVEVTMDPDSVESDNARFATLEVVDANPVLIIDGDSSGSSGRFIQDAIGADPKLTGFAPTVEMPGFLRTQPLDVYRCIYLSNVSSLSDDGLDALEKYVSAGGGLVWFVGDSVNATYYSATDDETVPTFYNEDGPTLFPVPLARTNSIYRGRQQPDIVFDEHPAFEVFGIEELQFASAIQLKKHWPVDELWERDDAKREDKSVTTIARLADGQPFAFEHKFGRGRVFTFLTALDREWTNWQIGDANPSFVIMNLDLQRVVAQTEAVDSSRFVGVPIEVKVAAADYRETVEIDLPERAGGQTIRMTATPESEDGSSTDLVAAYRDTDLAGVYRVRLTDQNQAKEEDWLAFNVSPTESNLRLADETELRKKVPDVKSLTIQSPGNTNWLKGRGGDSELRWLLLGLLLLLFIAEQALAYRLSYHPPARAKAI